MCSQSKWQRRRGQQEELNGPAPMRAGLHLRDEGEGAESLPRRTPSST